jgi:hypothetical protein
MDTQRIISELQDERDRIDQAIVALKTLSPNGSRLAARARKARPVATRTRRRSRLTAAGRKRLSELMKQRWAEQRRKKAA